MEVPQETVLGPPLFNVFTVDIDKAAAKIDLILKFADDTKGMKIIREEDRKLLQKTGQMGRYLGNEIQPEKCKILHEGSGNPYFKYTMGGVDLAEVDEEKYVGVIVSKTLKPASQSRKSSYTAQGVLHQLAQNFHFRDRRVFMGLYKQCVRTHLEFYTPARSLWLAGDEKLLETMRKRAVKWYLV